VLENRTFHRYLLKVTQLFLFATQQFKMSLPCR